MRDQTEAIVDAIGELEAEPPGDVLVFLSGEREIRDTAEALRGTSTAHRGAAAVRPAADGRAAEGLSAAHRPARRARHQRRRDVADRARHPLRRRPRHRTDLALQPQDEGAAAAHRADLPGLCRAAGGPLGSRRARRVHPPLLRGGLRVAASLHRPRDSADQPRRGDPADGRAATRRHRELPVPRPARQAQRPRRCAAAAGARRVRPRRRDHRRSAAASRGCPSTRGSAG